MNLRMRSGFASKVPLHMGGEYRAFAAKVSEVVVVGQFGARFVLDGKNANSGFIVDASTHRYVSQFG